MSNKDTPPPDFDPDATNTGPLAPIDPDQTVTKGSPLGGAGPGAAKKPASAELDFDISDPDISDPDITLVGGSLKDLREPDPDITVNMKAMKNDVDPDATFSGPLTQFDPDGTVTKPGGAGRRRANPFAPKALPEALQANLAALGGLNPLIAFANPILSAVPQIGAARNHPDPALLKETLQDLIEAFEAGASKAGVTEENLEAAVYALCCLADDSAASTPWGGDWNEKGLLKEVRNEANGGEEFFALLESVKQKPGENGDLLELFYICFALGFEGRYRDAPDRAQLERIRADLHALVTKRRGRPEGGLSERWRGVPAGKRAPTAAATSSAVPWRAVGGAAFALLVLFVGYKILQKPDAPPPPVPIASQSPVVAPPVVTPPVVTPPVVTPPAPAPAPAPSLTLHQVLEKELAPEIKQGVLALAEAAGRTTIAIRNDRQFPSGSVEPDPAVRAVLERLAEALERTPGAILVRGYADAVPVRAGGFPSNLELSAARAKAAAGVIAAKLSQPKRIASEGAGEADAIAPNDTEENRARNRRVAIVVGPQP